MLPVVKMPEPLEASPKEGAARVVLVSVVSGERYVRYARRMLASADGFFFKSGEIERAFVMLDGREGWPAATMYRYHVILEQADRFQNATHVYLIDADMRFVAPVQEEILGALVATSHPGYVGRRGTYEDRPLSAAFVGEEEGATYFCGGFVGGEQSEFLALSEAIREGVDSDAANGVTAVWHDESHLNRYLIDHPPTLHLSPSYCYPEDDQSYIQKVWPQRYEPRIVALRKNRFRAVLRRWL
jgi:histo-blood group ABO system transferase